VPRGWQRLDSIVDERGSPDRRVLSAGTPILQPTAERRNTGSHYTPRSLTEPIVRHALEPVFERLGPDARPKEVLDLKVCDPAMGSGAFLVEACRALAARLVQAWARWPETRPKLPADEDDDLHARRLVAQRCLYGVDKNPMATDLAKLSLWLATLARDHEFTFLDHALKSGDSLVGLTRSQIAALHWDSSKPGLPLFRDLIRERFEAALTGRQEIREAPDDVERAIQEARYQHIERRLSDARLLGDAVIAAFFSAGKPRAREAKRQEIESWLNEPPASMWMKVGGLAATLRQGDPPIPRFHWELEFPEVFARENPGFDAFFGNPPFLGGKRISTVYGEGYRDWLSAVHEESNANSDLVAHFYRAMFCKLRQTGTFGLIATNTIAQGDTRGTGLRFIRTHRGVIYAATKRLKWPGTAAVVVSVVHVIRGEYHGIPILDDRAVEVITAYLFHTGIDEDPEILRVNAGISFQGVIPLGSGFLFDDLLEGATSIRDMHNLLQIDARNNERIFPYLGGEEILEHPKQEHRRYVINFGEMSEEEARQWPDLLEILERKVRPERLKKSAEIARCPYWQFWRVRNELFGATRGLARTLAHPFTSTHLAFSFIPAGTLLAAPHTLIARATNAAFGALQSRPHEIWARFFASTLEDRLRYTPSNCFETFPFPENWATHALLDPAGESYYEFRAALMVRNNEGLTKTYNRFHDRRETAAEVVRLRELHTEMDRAVLRAYGWDDLAERAEPQFLDETNEDDHKYQGRLFWPAEFRDEVLARLLALNAERAAAERVVAIARSSRHRATKLLSLEDV
jgi:hypothetical protein